MEDVYKWRLKSVIQWSSGRASASRTKGSWFKSLDKPVLPLGFFTHQRREYWLRLQEAWLIQAQYSWKRCSKSRNCSSWSISPLPAMFSKDICFRPVKICLLWEKELKKRACQSTQAKKKCDIWIYKTIQNKNTGCSCHLGTCICTESLLLCEWSVFVWLV